MKSILACVVLAWAIPTQIAGAQGDPLGADEMAEAIISMTSPVWTGPRTAVPSRTGRPEHASRSIRSAYALVSIHAAPQVSERAQRRALNAVERVRARIDVLGWPAPISDGDLGGDAGVDLYLSGELTEGAHSDGLVPWTYLDRTSAFAVLSPATPDAILDACVTEAYLRALLLSAEPAESRSWRRATAAYVTWELTGRFGCDDAVFDQQAEPFRSWIRGGAGDGSGGALWLAYLGARHESQPARFARDVWGLASQRTWEGEQLRADPDLWSALESAVDRSGDRLLDNVEDLAVRRWFVGRGDPGDAFIASIDSDAITPVSRRMKRLPTRVVAPEPLQAFGSAYLLMSSESWGESRRLRAWLRGEYGVRWSFAAVQLDAQGNEIRRINAPQTTASPEAYLPIELDETTKQLLFVVTNLSNALPDADENETHQRAFEVTVDRADD